MEGILLSAAPLILAGLGALISDLSGALGIFMEGFMSAGAFFSWVFAEKTGSIFLGTTISASLAGLTGWALARFVRKIGANPFIAGLAVNLAVSGLINTLSALMYGTKGVLRSPVINTPEKIFGLSPFAYAVIILTAAAAIVISKTTIGLRLRASGSSPEACIEKGIRPDLYREGAWAAAAFLAALAGAALTFRVGAYTPGGIAGRGWIALAIVYLGFRRVWGAVVAALIFSLAERFGYIVQGLIAFPATAFLGLPSALALVLFTVFNWVRRKESLKK